MSSPKACSHGLSISADCPSTLSFLPGIQKFTDGDDVLRWKNVHLKIIPKQSLREDFEIDRYIFLSCVKISKIKAQKTNFKTVNLISELPQFLVYKCILYSIVRFWSWWIIKKDSTIWWLKKNQQLMGNRITAFLHFTSMKYHPGQARACLSVCLQSFQPKEISRARVICLQSKHYHLETIWCAGSIENPKGNAELPPLPNPNRSFVTPQISSLFCIAGFLCVWTLN